jgi:hypothetical protein
MAAERAISSDGGFHCAHYWRRGELAETWTLSRRDLMDALTLHNEHHCQAL